MRRLSSTVVLLWIAAAGTVAAQEPAPPLLIRDVTLIDGTEAPPRPHHDVVVRDGRIDTVAPTGGFDVFDGRVIDGSGRFLIPGLVDAHVHLSGGSRAAAEKQLRWLLEGGVTSVRDMAGDARMLAGLQQSLVTGEIVGPRIDYVALLAGRAFLSDPRLRAATMGYDEGESPYMIPVDEDTDPAAVVRLARGTGATGVKLYAALDASQVGALTTAAHEVGLEVWAHSAVFPARPVEILEAGVDGVSHAPYVIWDAAEPTPDFTLRAVGDFGGVPPDGEAMERVIAAMARAGTVLDPTLFVFETQAEAGDDTARARAAWGAAFTRAAHGAGVTLAAGTDNAGAPLAGAWPHVHREMELLVERAGLSPLDALRAGTRGGAAALGDLARRGTVEAGKFADLVLLSADPTLDITHSTAIERVIQGGRVVR